MIRDDGAVPPTQFRDDLLEQVRLGTLTPGQAELAAREAGLGPLAPEPDPARFDPMAELRWTLPMAVAWIAWRSPDAVREQWNAYRAERRVWRPITWKQTLSAVVREGAELQPVGEASLALMLLGDVEPRPPSSKMSVNDALKKLYVAFAHGEVSVRATELGTLRRVKIPPAAWPEMKWIEEKGGWLVPRSSGTESYVDVTLESKDVLAAWPRDREAVARLPEAVPPTGAGYMPLSSAVQWIATSGGSKTIDLNDRAPWDAAFRELLDQIASGEVTATGVRRGRRSRIDAETFANIPFEHAFGSPSLAFASEVYLHACPYLDEEHWRGGFDDRLVLGLADECRLLTVSRRDVAKLWPFGLHVEDLSSVPLRSGAPGKPTSMHLVEEEFLRRHEADEIAPKVSQEAAYLEGWLRSSYPKHPRLTAKAIANHLSGRHRGKFGTARY